jgi:hypothetical protein
MIGYGCFIVNRNLAKCCSQVISNMTAKFYNKVFRKMQKSVMAAGEDIRLGNATESPPLARYTVNHTVFGYVQAYEFGN